ncbi:MAG: SBBP repeat-containing protein [Bacteroidetes bacterium]|nr:SBBP repeat-containing protein [Bacteroidota bacterium]
MIKLLQFKKTAILLSAFFLSLNFSNTLQAQSFTWAKNMGGTSNDYGYSVAVDASGNVYTTGTFEGTADFDPGVGTFTLTSTGTADIFISKLDANGNFVWAKGIGGTTNDYGLTVAVDASGNVYTTGYFRNVADFDPGVGTFNLTSTSSSDDIFISKLDASGDFVWAKSIGGSNTDKCSGMKIDAAGNVFITGSFRGTTDFDPGAGIFNLTSAGNDDIFVSKLDASGNFVWAKGIGGTMVDVSQAITIDATGNVYTCGYFTDVVDFNPGVATYTLTSSIYNIFISKLDGNGDFVWAKHMVGGGDASQAITVDGAGNVYTTGYIQGTTDFDPGVGTFTLTSVGAYDLFISKLDANGDFVWAKSMGALNNESGLGITVDATGNVYTTGYFGNTVDFDPSVGTTTLVAPAGNYSIFISKLDALGNFVSAKSIGNSTGSCISYAITLDAANNIYTTGYYTGATDFDPDGGIFNLTPPSTQADVFILKLSSSTVSIAELNNEINVVLYPNPTNSIINIKLDEEIQTISIYNSLGALVQTEKTNSFSIEQLSSGLYILKVKTEKELKQFVLLKNNSSLNY